MSTSEHDLPPGQDSTLVPVGITTDELSNVVIIAFINFASGSNRGNDIRKILSDEIGEENIYSFRETKPQIVLDRYRDVEELRIIVCGGDGSVNWILSVCAALQMNNAYVGIIPNGTGNDTSRCFGWGQSLGSDHQIRDKIQHMKTPQCSRTDFDRWQIFFTMNKDDLDISTSTPAPTPPRRPDGSADDVHAFYADEHYVLPPFYRAMTKLSSEQFVHRYKLLHSQHWPETYTAPQVTVAADGTITQVMEDTIEVEEDDSGNGAVSSSLATSSSAYTSANSVNSPSSLRQDGRTSTTADHAAGGSDAGDDDGNSLEPSVSQATSTPSPMPNARSFAVTRPVVEESRHKAKITSMKSNLKSLREDGSQHDHHSRSESESDSQPRLNRKRSTSLVVKREFRIVEPQHPPTPGRWIHYGWSFNNYFSFGIDAQVMHNFGRHRENNPKCYPCRCCTMTWVGLWSPLTCCSCSKLPLFYEIDVLFREGDLIPYEVPDSSAANQQNKSSDIELAVHVVDATTHEALPNLPSEEDPIVLNGYKWVSGQIQSDIFDAFILLNIPSYAGGRDIWGNKHPTRGNTPGREIFQASSVSDGKLEACAMSSFLHMDWIVLMQGKAYRLLQIQGLRIHMKNDGYLQLDGEAWRQPKAIVEIYRAPSGKLLIDDRLQQGCC